MPDPSLGEISVDEARARMLAEVSPRPGERVALMEAFGRTLAEPVVAIRDQPPYDASSMDGYAVRRDAQPIDRFRLIGESAAGRPFAGDVAAGEAVRVFTGAAVPEGCRIIVQERAIRDSEGVTFEAHVSSDPNVRPRGGDFRAGETLLAKGARLDAWNMALVAAAGRGEVMAAPRPRITILSTGEEIVRAGEAASRGQIFDSNGPALTALISSWGAACASLEPAKDDETAIAAAVQHCGGDLIVTVGGASVGDHDLVKPALRRLGLDLKVDTVRLRPGKPTWFGVLEDGRRVLGLPGNPASALVCAELFLRPLLLAWQGADAAPAMQTARLAAPLPPVGPREHWMRARASPSPEGLEVHPFTDQDSSLVTVFAGANALIRRPSGAPATKAGDRVEMLRLERFGLIGS